MTIHCPHELAGALKRNEIKQRYELALSTVANGMTDAELSFPELAMDASRLSLIHRSCFVGYKCMTYEYYHDKISIITGIFFYKPISTGRV